MWCETSDLDIVGAIRKLAPLGWMKAESVRVFLKQLERSIVEKRVSGRHKLPTGLCNILGTS